MHINKPWRHDQILGIDYFITRQRLLGNMTNGTTANTHISNHIEIRYVGLLHDHWQLLHHSQLQ